MAQSPKKGSSKNANNSKKGASTKVDLATMNAEINLFLQIRKNFISKVGKNLFQLLQSASTNPNDPKETDLNRMTAYFYKNKKLSFVFDRSDIEYFLQSGKTKAQYKKQPRVNSMRVYFGAIAPNKRGRKVGTPTVIMVPSHFGSITNLSGTDLNYQGIEWPVSYDDSNSTRSGFDVSTDNFTNP